MTSSRAFTLIELMMVTAIIAGLAALAFPVIGMVRTLANKRASASNLRQIHMSMMAYLQQNDGRLPARSARGTIRASSTQQYRETVGAFEIMTRWSTGDLTGAIFRCPVGSAAVITTPPSSTGTAWNSENVGYAYDWAAPNQQCVGLRILIGERDPQWWGTATAWNRSNGSGIQYVTYSGTLDWVDARPHSMNTLSDDGVTRPLGSMNNPYFDPDSSTADRINGHWYDDIASARRNGALINQSAIAGGSATRAYIK